MQTLYMHRVTTISTTKEGYKVDVSLFQDKQQAEDFRNLMESKGHSAVLNRWSWQVQIED